jgi:hypothetical protein
MNNKGFIYCLYNPTFKSYGDNVYKLGKTKNLISRMSAYTTSYVDKSEYKITSSELNDRNVAENMLFKELATYRINMKREFFKCDIKIIIDAFEKVEKETKHIVNNQETQKIVKQINLTESKQIDTNNKYYCTECNKKYKSSKSLWNHNKIFHGKQPKIKEYKCVKCNETFDNKHKKYYHQKKCTGIKNKPNTIITINNNVINIINNYNNDNLEYISEIFKTEEINNMIMSAEYNLLLPKLIENIKFNPHHKENHNVKITSDRSKIGLYYDNNKWKAINKNDLLDELCDYSLKIFTEYFEEYKGELSEDIISKFKSFSHITKLRQVASQLRKEIKEKIENIAYIFTKNNEIELDV